MFNKINWMIRFRGQPSLLRRKISHCPVLSNAAVHNLLPATPCGAWNVA